MRVIDLRGSENLIEFTQKGIADFELRSGDLATFSYLKNKLQVVQNFTIGRHLSLKSGCSTTTIVICLVLAGLFIFLFVLVALVVGLFGQSS